MGSKTTMGSKTKMRSKQEWDQKDQDTKPEVKDAIARQCLLGKISVARKITFDPRTHCTYAMYRHMII